MRRILFPLLVIGLAAGLFTLGSGAFFSDVESDTGNTITAGTLDLKLTDASPTSGDDETATLSVTNAKPGDSGSASLTVQNTGSLSGTVDLSGITVTNNENGCVEPESSAPTSDTSCGNPGPGDGELAANLDVKLCWDATANGDCDDGGDTLIFNGKLSTIAAAYDLDTALANGASITLTMEWSIANTVGNVIQSDGVNLDFTVELDQNAD